MKRSTILVALAAVALPMSAHAQSTLNVTAKVQSVLTATPVAGNTTLDFGTSIAPGGTVSVANSGSTGYQTTIVGNVAASLSLGTTTVSLTGSNGGSLSVSLSCATAATSHAASTTALAGCAGALPSLPGTVVLYIGGSVTVPAAAAAGNYSGSTSITYTYTSY